MKKVLIIAYYFPPMGGGGVQRTAKFVKYLPVFGWEPVVLTVREEIYKKTKRIVDPTLLNDLPSNICIVRTNSIDLGRISSELKPQKEVKTFQKSIKSLINKIGGLFINPDAQMLWIPIAVKEGLKLIKRFSIDVIYSTGNPWSDHIAGFILKKITGLPWIADFRDPWNLNQYIVQSSRMRKKIQIVLETKVVNCADRVIFTTEKTMEHYKKEFKDSKFVTIRNAFDPSDFVSIQPKKFPKFSLLYAGNMQSYRGPCNFIKALTECFKEYPQAKQEIMVNILGQINTEAKRLIEKNGLQDSVNLIGHVSHNENIAYLLGADVLLSIVNHGGELIIPGKIFEYLASGKPVLALIPGSGSAAEILKKEGRGEYIVDPRNVIEIKSQIMNLYTLYKTDSLPRYPTDNLQAYTRKEATAKLSKLLDKVKS